MRARTVACSGGIVFLFVVVACGPSKNKGKVGAFCDNDSDCESGLCFENECLDPDGDEDGDGLKNGIEVHQLGTNPLKADTDNDGTPDLLEVGDIASPKDSDGDGLIDALESSLLLADPDRDCLPDQFDPNNQVPDSGKEREIAQLFCQKGGGVCTEQLDQVQAACVEGEVHCDYSAVSGYQEVETWCDAKDNDCDGKTDANLTSTTEGECAVAGVCGAHAETLLRECVNGQWVCRYDALTDWEESETRFDGLDNDCDGLTDEGLAGETCENVNEFGKCPGMKVFRDGQVVCDGRVPAAEVCDGEDNDCDSQIDEGLVTKSEGECSSKGVCGSPGVVIMLECRKGKWVCKYEEVVGYETEEQACDGLDNDCDGQTDEGLVGQSCQNQNEHGICSGKTVCGENGKPVCGAPVPSPEACDQKDNDCDGETDEGLSGLPCPLDNEYGTCPGTTSCANGKLTCVGLLPAMEICDANDNDCDGQTDEGLDGVACEIKNAFGTCLGETLCKGGQLVCTAETPSKEVCNGNDDDCDGLIDENDICLKTSSVKGMVRDGATLTPVQGARVDFYLGGAFRQDPVDSALSDAQGRFEVALIPGWYWVVIQAVGYEGAETWSFVLQEGDAMPLEVALRPVEAPTWYFSVCGRVTTGSAAGYPKPVAGASVVLYGNGLSNPLAAATSGPQGFYCISGVSAYEGGSGSPFEFFALMASMSGFMPGTGKYLPNYPNQVVIQNIFLPPPPPGAHVFLQEDFESAKTEWTTEEPISGVGWQWIQNGQSVNEALGKCVMPPALFESCVPDPSDPGDRCAICEKPTDPACIPAPGALPNAHSGSGAFWFGNPLTTNYLPSDGKCNPLSGGKGGPVWGSLTSPWIKTGYAFPLFLSFYSAWEIESVDPQGPPDGYDLMLIEVQKKPESDWVLIGSLNPDVDVNGEAYQPYTSGGFNQAPIWVNYIFDLSKFSDVPEIRIRFRFHSKDENYNAFRGWLVDDVQVFGVIPSR